MSLENDLVNNEEFMEKLENTETPDEAVKLFEEYGVTVTKEELMAEVEASSSSSDEELNETALQNVSGGSMKSAIRTALDLLRRTHGPKRPNKWYTLLR